MLPSSKHLQISDPKGLELCGREECITQKNN